MVKLLLVLAGPLIVFVGCSSPPERLSPMLPTGPAPAVPPPVTFQVEFPDWVGVNRTARTHELPAPVDGTFILNLTWDPAEFDGTLKMTAEDRPLADSRFNCSPVVGRIDAKAGETHRVTVSAETAELSHFGIYSTAYLLTATFEEHGSSLARPAPPIQPAGAITEIRDTYWGGRRTYAVTSPGKGTLVSHLAWNAARRDAARLGLSLGGQWFPPAGPSWSPVVGRIAVEAGQTCRVDVEESFAIWDFFDDPFVITFTLE